MSSDDAELMALRPRWIALAEAADAALNALAAADSRCGALYPARPRWKHGDSEDPQEIARHEKAMSVWNHARLKVDAKEGLTAIRDRELEAGRALYRFMEEIAAAPARTIAGLQFKAEAARADENTDSQLLRSLADDIIALRSDALLA